MRQILYCTFEKLRKLSEWREKNFIFLRQKLCKRHNVWRLYLVFILFRVCCILFCFYVCFYVDLWCTVHTSPSRLLIIFIWEKDGTKVITTPTERRFLQVSCNTAILVYILLYFRALFYYRIILLRYFQWLNWLNIWLLTCSIEYVMDSLTADAVIEVSVELSLFYVKIIRSAAIVFELFSITNDQCNHRIIFW